MEENHGDSGDDAHHSGEYIVTRDWDRKMRSLKTVGLEVPELSDPFYKEASAGLIQRLQEAFPTASIRVTDMTDLAEAVISKAMARKALLKNAIIVSTCPEIAHIKGGFSLEINRIVDCNGKIIGLGPRPGHSSLREQVLNIKSVVNGSPVILVEDGTFTGSTMIKTYEMLHSAGVHVEAMAIGYAFASALDNIKRIFPGEVMVIEEIGDFIDWMPDHDFFPFTPGCGRVVGVKWQEECMPLYTHNGASYAIPYLTSFCPMTEWTSVPKKDTLALSVYCLETTKNLFGMIEQLNHRAIMIGDLASLIPRVNTPIAIGSKSFHSLDVRVTDFISEALSEID